MLNRDNKRFFVISSIVIIAISFFTYLTSLKGFFIESDFTHLVSCKYEKLTHIYGLLFIPCHDSAYRPLLLADTDGVLEYRLWGLNPLGYRLVSLMLHSINSILVLFLSFFLLKDKIIALGAGVLFAIHPIHSGLLSFIMQRHELIFSPFYLLSLVSFALFISNQRYRFFYLISIFSYPLALLSKEMAITLPLTLILWDSFLEKWSLDTYIVRLRRYIPYINITVLYIIWRTLLTGSIAGHINSRTGRPFFFNFNFLDYLSKAAYYIPLEFFTSLNRSLFSSRSIQWITVVIILGIIISIVLSYKDILKHKHLILFGFLWIIITLIPVHHFIERTNIVLTSRFVYLPSVGFCIILAFLILIGKTGRIRRYFSLGIFVIICVIYIFVTNKNNSAWISVGELNRSIPRIVQDYYKRYGANIKCYFLMPAENKYGILLFTNELPEALAPLFAPLSHESVVVLSDNHATRPCLHIRRF